MKNLIYILLLSVFFISCNSSKPAIITSKAEAIKKNKYDTNVDKSVVKKVRPKKESIVVIKEEKKKKKTVINDSNDDDLYPDDSNYLANQIIESAKENIGVRYKMGGTSKAGFDCSGLMCTTFQKYNISLPRTSSEMSQTGYIVDKDEAKKGDLIFFSTNGRGNINHVGMIVEVNEDGIKFIHASTSSGVIISSLNESYYSRAFKRINRVLE
jgi:murein DD-endopeptidase / murein LD-carboxypeptidase